MLPGVVVRGVKHADAEAHGEGVFDGAVNVGFGDEVFGEGDL